MNYWGRAKGSNEMCACGVPSSCSNEKKMRLLSSSHTAMKELLGIFNFFLFKINALFAGLTSGFTLITPSDVAASVVPDMPSESLVLSCKAYRALRAVK